MSIISHFSQSTGYLAIGQSFTWRDCTVAVLGLGTNRLNCRFTFPWGYTMDFEIWEGGNLYRKITSTNTETWYDGRYNYVWYIQEINFVVTGVFETVPSSNNRIEFRIDDDLNQVAWFLDSYYTLVAGSPSYVGNDNNTGINWAHAWRGLNKAATTIKYGGQLWIASGNYLTDPGTTAIVAPTNVTGDVGIWYILKDPHSSGVFEALTGEAELGYQVPFEHTAWGEYEELWNVTRRNYRWVRGWKSSLCNFVTSDKLITDGYGMEMLIDDDTEYGVTLGASLILEDGWSVKLAEISPSDVVKVEIYDTGSLQATLYEAIGNNAIYSKAVKGVTLPIIVINLREVFRGTETTTVYVQGIVQISDYYMSLT